MNPPTGTQTEDGYRLLKPRLCELLDLLRMGVAFHRASGDRLWFREKGREIEILDLAGGFGSLLLGHNHPALVAEAQTVLAEGRPIHAQGSRRTLAGRLAKELSRRCGGNYRVVLANSGAEAVEAAMKHAILETGSRTFIALERAFHGKTLGAVQLTANAEVRDPFVLPGLHVARVRPNDIAQLEATFARLPDIAGFIYEPIQGEGGVRTIDDAFLDRAAKLCAERNVPLIADEIQTGLGRTGTFLASPLRPDYLLFSKTLGGGLAKVSALLVRADRFVPDFDRLHTSTYAEDDFSSAIALKSLELIDDLVIARCREKGERLLVALRRLQEKYPAVIADVRGRGLMIGLTFHGLPRSRSFLLRLLSAQDDLVLVLAGYFFNVHRIRVLPTLSDPHTLRIEPSAFIPDADLDRFVAAVEDVCHRLVHGDALALTAYFLREGGRPPEEVSAVRPYQKLLVYDEPRFQSREEAPPAVRVGWLFHLIDADDLTSLEPPFGDLSYEKREHYLQYLSPRAHPIVMNSTDVRSASGAQLRFHAILLPFTSRRIKQWIDEGDLGRIQIAVLQGIEVARTLGCGVVSLGQYTSIVTLNGTSVRPHDLGVTTGNSYAIALALQALEKAHADRGVDPAASTLAIVGASGNIGRTCAEILAPRYRKLILVGSGKPGALFRLAEFAKTIPNAEIATEPSAVRPAHVILAATNAVNTPLRSEHIGRNAIVCDLSVPATLARDTFERFDLLAIKGGVARLPHGEDLEIAGFPLPAGQAYGCMAEGMLLGFEDVRDTEFTGSLTAVHVERVTAMAAKHGFRLADYKTECVLGSEAHASH